MSSTISYAVRGLSKEFGGRLVVSDAAVTVEVGTIHGVIGKNGAGKSVLMSMVAGTMSASSGEIQYGPEVVPAERTGGRVAHAHGVRLISQEPPVLPYLRVVDYLFLGAKGASRAGCITGSVERAAVAEIDERLRLGVRPNDAMIDLPIEVQQLLAFGKAVMLEHAPIVLLDEITASLSGPRRAALLTSLRELSASRSFTLISHRVAEIMDVCDTVTVMRDGIAEPERRVADVTEAELAALIVGEVDMTVEAAREARTRNHDLALEYRAAVDGPVVLSVARGEVLGLAGIEGSGKDELLESIAGLRDVGGIAGIGGKSGRVRTPRAATKRGVAYLPKKREEYATIHGMTVLENMVLPAARMLDRSGLWRSSVLQGIARDRIHALDIRPARDDVDIDSLSGGNRQKVMIGRLQLLKPAVYLLNEPTRGIDIATKPKLLAIVRNDLAADAAVVMTSEAEEELVECCDRVVVFWKGSIVAELHRGEPAFTVDSIFRLSQGMNA